MHNDDIGNKYFSFPQAINMAQYDFIQFLTTIFQISQGKLEKTRIVLIFTYLVEFPTPSV